MATTSNNDIARAVYLASKDKNHFGQTALSKQVVEFLFRKKLLSKSGDILSRLKKIVDKEEGRTVVKVSSAEALSHKDKLHLEHAMKKRYSSQEVVLEETLDKNLFGGFRLETNGEIIDLSVKNRIEKLKEHLIKNV